MMFVTETVLPLKIAKLSQLEAYKTLHSYDVICLSEMWLDSTTSIDSNVLFLKGYNLYRVDDPDK